MKSTQKNLILEHLKKYGKITSWAAIQMYGIMCPRDIIYLLRKDGHIITGQRMPFKSRHGFDSKYMEYRLTGG